MDKETEKYLDDVHDKLKDAKFKPIGEWQHPSKTKDTTFEPSPDEEKL